MKNIFVTCSLLVACSVTLAQGYAGAVVALTNFDANCGEQMSCDNKGHGVKVYFGSKLAKESQIDLGFAKLDSVEVGLINFGKGRLSYSRAFVDPDNGPYLVNAATVNTANALTAAAVIRMPVFDGAAFLVRPGLAYVSSTQRYYVSGVQDGSETATKFKPYLGLGVEYAPMDNFKIVGSFDFTQFDVAGQKANLKSLGLGAEIGF